MQLRSATFALCALLALARPGVTQEEPGRALASKRPLYTAKTAKAVSEALRWLANHQNKDGSWSARVGFKINDGYRLQPDNQPDFGLPHLGVTSLAAMAFLSGGHLPRDGEYGKVMDKALQFVLSKVKENGYIKANGTRMYSHAFSLLFLTEVYGMTGNTKLREKLDLAVEFTIKSQNNKGGWRYAPLAQDSDMSITVCQVVALREARNIGIRVPKATIDTALRYVMESAVTARGDRGAFLYQHKRVPFNRNSFALTAAGLTTLYQAGLYRQRDIEAFARANRIRTEELPRVRYCLDYLRDNYDQIWHGYNDHYFYFYGNYYAAQAMYALGGSMWRSWYEMVRDDLLSIKVTREGARGRETRWRSRHVGDAFSTSVAAIILQVPNHYLPIFQR